MSRNILGILLVCAGVQGYGAERWKVQYFYDKLDSSLVIQDLECPTAERCVAVGAIDDKNGHLKPAQVVTGDGGAHWDESELKEVPYSLFFHDGSLGWMVTEKGVWQTVNGGGRWAKVSKEEQLEQVYFADANHGWAAGRGGILLESTDGGKQWQKLQVPNLAWPTDQVVYEWIGFAGPDMGFLAGSAYPYGQRRSARPEWMDPERARRFHSPPVLSFFAASKDGGKTWQASKPFSQYGDLGRVQHLADGNMLTVLQFDDGAEWPSEVAQVDMAANHLYVVYRRKDRVVKDAVQLPNGDYIVATIEPPGLSSSLPIPGKLRMVQGHGGDTWKDVAVDYRAVARNALLGFVDPKNIWVATDTGMILKLELEAAQTKQARTGLSTELPPGANAKALIPRVN